MLPSGSHSSSDSTPPSGHYRGSGHGPETSSRSIDKEWDALQVAKKRLALEQERLTLEKEMLKAERKNMKRSAKLSKQSGGSNDPQPSRNDASSKQTRGDGRQRQLEEEVAASQQEIQTYQQQLRRLEVDYEEKLAAERTNHNDRPRGSGTTSPQQDDLDAELQTCRKDLQATQRSLAALLVERDDVRQEKETLQEKLAAMESKLKENQASDCERLTLKVAQLEDDLQSMKNSYAMATAKYAEDKRLWMEEQQQNNSHASKDDQGQDYHDSAFSADYVEQLKDLLKNYEDENGALRLEKREMERQLSLVSESSKVVDAIESSAAAAAHQQLETLRLEWQQEKELLESHQLEQEQQWQREKQAMERQLQQQSQKMEDWKLLLPRNKVLLEQAQSKNEQLKVQLDETRKQQREQSSKLRELEAEKDRLELQLQEQDQHQETGKKEVVNGNGNTIASTPSTKMTMNPDASALDPTGTSSAVVIPSDFTQEELMSFNMEKKHVIEWEWTNRNGDLAGKYTGWLDLVGDPDGHGTLRIEDGSIYTGSWVQGRRAGYGVYTSIDGALFAGPWLNDVFHGRGVYVSETNQLYTGDWDQGKRHGKGVESWEYGARYVGGYDQDKRSGRGSFIYADGRRFVGDYKNDRPDGHGKQTASDGSVLYDGAWSMGEFLGGA